MNFIEKVSEEKLVDFAVQLIENKYADQLKYSNHIGTIITKYKVDGVKVRVCSVDQPWGDVFHIKLSNYSAKVCCLDTGDTNEFNEEFINFMISAVPDKEAYIKPFNSVIDSRIQRLEASYNAQRAALERRKIVLPTAKLQGEDSDENC